MKIIVPDRYDLLKLKGGKHYSSSELQYMIVMSILKDSDQRACTALQD